MARPPRLTWGEVLVLALALLGSAVAWASLLLAHAGRHTTTRAVFLGLVVAVPIAALIARRRPAVRFDAGEAGGLVLLAALAGIFYFPGWPRALGDSDPGVYLAHAAHIARSGSFELEDPVVEPSFELAWRSSRGQRGGGVRFPGFYVHSALRWRVVPQFHALYPAFMATVRGPFERAGMLAVNPMAALVALLAFFLLMRRAFGAAAAWLGGAMLAISPVQIWNARYPTAEMMTLALLLVAGLSLVIGHRERLPLAAGLAGGLVSLGWLARPDGLFIVLIAVAGVALAGALGEGGPTGRAFTLGLLVPLPHALVQALAPEMCGTYNRLNHLPGLAALATIITFVFVSSTLFRVWATCRPLPAQAAIGTFRRHWRTAAVVTSVLVVAGAYVRPWLFDPPLTRSGVRTFAELSMLRLTVLLTAPAMTLAGVGLLRVALGRLRIWRLVVLLPLLLLPLYLYQQQFMGGPMRWTRRFLWFWPSLVALAGLALALAFVRRRPWTGRIVAIGAWTAIMGSLVGPALALRAHVELDGAFELIDRVGSLGQGRPTVILFYQQGRSPLADALGGPVWGWHGVVAARLPGDVQAEDVLQYQRVFAGHTVFMVSDAVAPPQELANLPWELEEVGTAALPIWRETRLWPARDAWLWPIRWQAWRLGPEVPVPSGNAADP